MKNKKIRNSYLAILASFVFITESNVQADESILTDVFFGDIKNIAIGGFSLKEDMYLFSIPKDWPATHRGQIWGMLFVFEYQGEKHPIVEIFDCGLKTSHMNSYTIDFSSDDKYLVIESGGEGGSVIDVFRFSDLYDPSVLVDPVGKGWAGTGECVEPLATVGGYNVPAGFYGWSEHMPLIRSRVPLDEITTSKEVWELEKQGLCCDGEPEVFAWDIFSDQFTVIETP